jgi:undecaprenyl-diphosphatase
MDTLQTIIISIVEGLTEFLPVSSTGHMIITQNLLGVQSTPFVKAFTVIIQFGAILSVVVLYWKRFFCLNNTPMPKESTLEFTPMQQFLHKWDFYWKLLIAFIPAVVIGGALNHFIDKLLGHVEVVAVMLVLGGIFMLFCDKLFNKGTEETELTEKRALKIGFFQCLAMIPGVSRSMATIVGGMSQRLTRRRAAEFSFFLAVPTMAAATCLDVLKLVTSKDPMALSNENIFQLLLGCVVAFVVAMAAIKWFIDFLAKYGFKAFGVYRIIVGGFILIWLLTGHSMALVD